MFFSKIFIFGATLGLLRFVIGYHFGWLKKIRKFKFFEWSRDVKEHIFKEKNRKIFFSWSVEILKVGELQKATVYQGVVQKNKKCFLSFSKTLGRHTLYSSF